jgi:hypothetical protein
MVIVAFSVGCHPDVFASGGDGREGEWIVTV